jgi:DNA-binding IclR family transcriptional regulator
MQKLIIENMWDGCSIQELAEEIGMSKWQVYIALRRLEARGVVRQEPVDRAALVGDRRRQPRVRWYRA